MRKKRPPSPLRTEVCERANRCCEYCRANSRYSESPFEEEHAIPKARGGETTAANLAWGCRGCNGRKWAFIDGEDPETGKMERLYNPREDQWPEHFAWSDDFTVVMGLTGVGRATINRLELNRSGLRMQRAVLRKEGVHPPDFGPAKD